MPQVDYIATVDTGSASPEGRDAHGEIALIDAVPLSALERIGAERREGMDTVPADALDHLLLEVPAARVRNLLDEGPGWFRIRISDAEFPGSEGIEVLAPAFGTPDEREDVRLRMQMSLEDIPRSSLQTLERIGRIAGVPDATAEEIAGLFPGIYPAAIGVYDVGQGSFSALVNDYEHPLLFFDLGWPIRSKAASRPNTPRFAPFSLDKGAPVVLSHLDFDHWGYAIESGQARWNPQRGYWSSEPVYRKKALERPWLMRRPNAKRHKLGPSHLHFALTLAEAQLPGGQRVLHVWPERKQSVRVGSITVFKCSNRKGGGATPKYLRNNESLGLHVHQGATRALLCGDADYPSIPPRFLRKLTGMVAPHHGGATTAGTMPAAVGHGRMVMSTYENAYPGIPHKDVLQEARRSGWAVARTDDRFDCTRCGARHGHRMIRLGATPLCTCDRIPRAQLCINNP